MHLSWFSSCLLLLGLLRILCRSAPPPDGSENSRGQESSGKLSCDGIITTSLSPISSRSHSNYAQLFLPLQLLPSSTSSTCRTTLNAANCARAQTAANRPRCRVTRFASRQRPAGRPWPITVTRPPPTRPSVAAASATRANSFACALRPASTHCPVSYYFIIQALG